MSEQTNPDERFDLEVSFITRRRNRERQRGAARPPVDRELECIGDVMHDLAEQNIKLEEKVRAVVENGERVRSKVDALIAMIRLRLERDGIAGDSSS